MEIWKDIKGYEGFYQISNMGRVRSVDRIRNSKHHGLSKIKGRMLIPLIQDGYYLATLCKNGEMKHFRIHRLVAEAFIPNPDNLPFINHIDENKSNNKVDNLEWCTRSYNNNYGHRNQKISVARQKIEQEKRIRKNVGCKEQENGSNK